MGIRSDVKPRGTLQNGGIKFGAAWQLKSARSRVGFSPPNQAGHQQVVREKVASSANARLPPQPRARRIVFLHRQSARSSLKPAGRRDRSPPQRRPNHDGAASVSHRRVGRVPDHMHCIWTLPSGDAGFPLRWQSIKAAFSRSVPSSERTPFPHPQARGRHLAAPLLGDTIRDEEDFAAHMDYIHFNPVNTDLRRTLRTGRFSSFARCVALGIYPRDWGGEGARLETAGERP